MSHPAEVVQDPHLRPPNEEAIIQKQYVRHVLDPLQAIGNIIDINEETLLYGEPHPYYHNVLKRIQEEYRPVNEHQVLWMRSRKDWGEPESRAVGYGLFFCVLLYCIFFVFLCHFGGYECTVMTFAPLHIFLSHLINFRFYLF